MKYEICDGLKISWDILDKEKIRVCYISFILMDIYVPFLLLIIPKFAVYSRNNSTKQKSLDLLINCLVLFIIMFKEAYLNYMLDTLWSYLVFFYWQIAIIGFHLCWRRIYLQFHWRKRCKIAWLPAGLWNYFLHYFMLILL